MNQHEQLRGHLETVLANGLTEAALVEVMTHLAFYAERPNAFQVSIVAKEVFRKK